MKSILFGVIFWAVLLVMIWLIRPKSKLLGITMERWSMAHRLVTILVLAALIGSSSYLMTLCPMWNGEITAQLMEEIEARKAEQAASDEAVKNSDSPAVTAGEEKWKASATDVMRANANSDQRDRFAIKNKNQYELMADALLKGQLYLEYGDMDPRLLAMENPYECRKHPMPVSNAPHFSPSAIPFTGCPARIRTSTEWTKTTCATVTPPGKTCSFIESDVLLSVKSVSRNLNG